MKRTFIIIVNLVYILLLISCSFNGTIKRGAYRTQSSSKYYLKFEYMDGTDTHCLKLEKGDRLEVKLEKSEGVIAVQIGIEGENPIYRTSDGGNMEFFLEIEKSGDYLILVEARDAKGTIDISKCE